MDPRKAQLLGELAPAAVPLFQYWLEERHIMKQTEAQKEVIEAQAQAMKQPQGVQPATQAQQAAMGQPQGVQPAREQRPRDRSDELRRLAQEESCGTCAAALREASKYGPEMQEVALNEYEELKDRMSGDVSSSEIANFLEGTEVLGEALNAAV